MKAYRADHRVTAEEVDAMLGVLSRQPNVSKGIITTTADFAPGVYKNEEIQRFVPHRLELKPRDELIKWLASLAARMP